MMEATRYLELELAPDLLERQTIDSVLPRVASVFENAGGPRSGLFLATPDAGNRTALRFWEDAQKVGVALANPELFPWCLANAPCAALARHFAITGPNFTWIGGEDALQAAWAAAEIALTEGRVQLAFAVHVVFGKPGSHGRLRIWCLRQSSESPPPVNVSI